jgi:N-acetylglucosaminyldiphosphoundecaprenol N-acetyl-beta-D-mannosaminyltransferase
MASVGVLGLGAVWGAVNGGDLRMAYFQLAGLLRMFLLVPIFFAVFRTVRDLELLAKVVLAAAVYRAGACILCFHLFVLKGGMGPWPEYVTDHHDSVLWVTVLLGLLVWLALRFRTRTVLMFALVAPLLMLAMHYNDRRLAWLELAGGLGLAYLVTPRPQLRRFNRLAVMAAPALLAYLVVGWQSQSALFAPIAKVRSAMASGEQDDSNRARELEDAGLVLTLQGNRLIGKGFGQPFEEMSDVYSAGMESDFTSYRYLPHNSVLGLVAFTGLLGFPLAWVFLSVGAFLAARARAFARRPSEQVLATVAFCVPLVYGLQAFGDMGLQSHKANLLLACALATAARLAVLTGAWPLRRPAALRMEAVHGPIVGPPVGAPSLVRAELGGLERSRLAPADRFFLGNVPVDPLTLEEAIDRIGSLVDAEGGTVFTPNVDHVVLAEEAPAFRAAYQSTSLSLVDGMPVLWACRMLGYPVPEKVSGSDLVRPLLARAAACGWRVYLLGGRPGVADRARALLTSEFPDLQIAGVDSPPVDMGAPAAARQEITERIRTAQPDLVLVALGSPKGELWAAEARAALPATVIVGVGAALDFLTGAQARAPRWLSEHGLEWLYRLSLEPRRLWQRYLLRGPRFLPVVLRSLREQVPRLNSL